MFTTIHLNFIFKSFLTLLLEFLKILATLVLVSYKPRDGTTGGAWGGGQEPPKDSLSSPVGT